MAKDKKKKVKKAKPFGSKVKVEEKAPKKKKVEVKPIKGIKEKAKKSNKSTGKNLKAAGSSSVDATKELAIIHKAAMKAAKSNGEEFYQATLAMSAGNCKEYQSEPLSHLYLHNLYILIAWSPKYTDQAKHLRLVNTLKCMADSSQFGCIYFATQGKSIVSTHFDQAGVDEAIESGMATSSYSTIVNVV